MDFPTLITSLETSELFQLCLCAIGVGMAKTGLGGLGLLVVPVMASIFGAKASTGILLIILISADIFGVKFYHRHADISKLVQLIPSTVIGILISVFFGEQISEEQFKTAMAVIIITGVLITITQKVESRIAHPNKIISNLIGILSGISTMVGNAAGPVMTLYFLAMGFKKNKFIGTAAWFFLSVNLFKVPFHIIFWNTIDFEVFYSGLIMLPLTMIGAFLGYFIVKFIPERPYKIILILSIVLSVFKLLLTV